MFNNFNYKFITNLLVISLIIAGLSLTGCGKKNENTMMTSKIKIENQKTENADTISEDQTERPEHTELRTKFDKAKKQNSDTVAWIRIPNTTIDDPVVQDLQNRGTSSEAYYLYRDFNGNRVAVGRESAIMSDKNNVTTPFDKLSKNLIISGHNVNLNDSPNGKMFAPLGHFKDLKFSKNNPYIFVTTQDKDLVYEVFASYYSEERFGFFLPKASEKEMTNMINEAKQRSNFIYDDVNVSEKDKVLTLYTCTYHFGAYRTLGYYRTKYVVQAKLLDEGTKLKEKANVRINPNPKQVYFTYCAKCNKNMTLEKCSANGGLCDDCKNKK